MVKCCSTCKHCNRKGTWCYEYNFRPINGYIANKCKGYKYGPPRTLAHEYYMRNIATLKD